MNKQLILLLSIVVVIGIFIFPLRLEKDSDVTLEPEEIELRPSDYFFMQRAYPHGTINQEAYREAVQYRQSLQGDNSLHTRNDDPWQFNGPTNIGGRITDIEMHASDTLTIYAGAASGGIFRSDDQGVTWEAIFDDQPTLSIGDLAIAPSNKDVIYVGTGESNAGGGSLAYDGLGVFRSINGGQSWAPAGLDHVGSIGRVQVDPGNPNRVFVAAMGHLFGNNPDRGVYRTLDGGQNWEQVLFLSDSTGAVDLVIHPNDPDIIYAAMWERIRRPDRRSYGGATSGIYRSTNGGDTWSELTSGLPTAPSQKGRIGLTIAASNPNVLYAVYADQVGLFPGVFRTNNGGDSWENLNPSGIQVVPFMWWFGKISVDPNDPETVYVASLNMHKSEFGGNGWTSTFEGVHVDQHALYVHPQNSDLVINGNDGGVYVSHDAGDSWVKSDGLPITQFYTCEIDPSNPERLYGGTQDNSPMVTRGGAIDGWQIIFGGDGFYTLVDPRDPDRIYTESQFGNFARSLNGGQTWLPGTVGIDPADRRNWNTPVVFRPDNPDVLYYGTYRLYASQNNAENWSVISPDLTNGDPGGNLAFGTITTIDLSPVDPRIMYVGTDDGNVWTTEDNGVNWTKVTDGLPNRWVTRVAADPFDPKTAYVTISGYRFNEYLPHVYKTEDQGVSWTSISGNLPDAPVNDIIPDPIVEDLLYLATDIGVFFSFSGGAFWEPLGVGLPNVVVTDLDYHEPTQALVAATYGRSMYSYSLDNIVDIEKVEFPKVDVTVYPNPVQNYFTVEAKFEGNMEVILSVVNLTGQPVLRQQERLVEGTNRWEFESQDWPAGSYYLSIQTEAGEVIAARQLIKQ